MNGVKTLQTGLLVVAVVAACCLGGCKGWDPGPWSWFDPSLTVRQPAQTTINPIYAQVGPTDQTSELVPNATMPRPEDLQYSDVDYVIGPSDILRISVLDLLNEGVETVLERQVTQSGYVDMPLLANRVRAGGLTQDQLADVLKRAYSPDILRNPVISVIVAAPRQNTFSILGAVNRAGTYQIIRKDFRLFEALALASDVSQTNIEWIYVIRSKPHAGASAAPTVEPGGVGPARAPATTTAPGTRPAGGGTIQEQLEDLEKFIPGAALPAARPAWAGNRPMTGSWAPRPALADAGTAPSPATNGTTAPNSAIPARRDAAAPAAARDLAQAAVTYKWIYSDGQWLQVPQSAYGPEEASSETAPAPARPPAAPDDPFGWMKYDATAQTRIIAINLAKLKDGDARMNIIIRENDIVQVPMLEVGEFYVMGEVQRPGVYSLTGRKVTVKMAVSAAGNLGALAWPNNSILIRRVGRDQEQTVPLPINDIVAGKEPDLFLKPNDVIAVGSYWAAPFLAVWRNAFRMTYGFGFIYDRNYSDREFEIPLIAPKSGYRY